MSIDFLNSIDMPFWKVPSGEVTNYPYLRELGRTGKPVVMSTGMCETEEIRAAIEVLRENGTKEIKLLHCNTEYPTPFCDVNLRAMKTLRDEFGLEVGYSDHTKGIEVPIAAVAMGATVIEKHFTLDRNMEGPDHKASLEPHELAEMVRSIRHIEEALGTGEKKPSPSEKKNKAVTPTPVEDKQEAAVPAEPATAAAPSGYVDSQLLFKVFQAAKDKKYESIFTFRLGADWGVETLFQLDQETLEKLMEAIVESKSIRISDFVLFPREATNGQIAYDTGLIISLNGHVQVLTPDGMILKFERSAVIKLGKRINIRRLEVEDCQKGGTQ